MDQLNNDLRQCIDLLDSSKITERRKKCSDLQDYLQRQDVINLLNHNTKNKDGITWDAVLATAHRGLLKEADKIRDEELKGKGISRLDNPKASFSGLINTVISKANAGGVQRLGSGQLLQCVLSILQERFHCKHFGYTYLQVLRHQVLTCHTYCANVGEDNWKDLLQLCELLYRNPPPRVDKILILSILNLIIKKGGNHSFVALEIKKKFPFIIECIKGDARTLNLQEHLARLALTVCQTLQYESRMAICKFGEEVMSDLRNMYDHRETGVSKKKDVLLEWFVLQVRAHHPGGARRGCLGAYAGAWDVWVRQLGWLYQLITAEVMSLLKHRSACRTLRPAFVTLVVCVCKQVFETDSRQLLDMSLISNLEDTSMIDGHSSGNAPKRIRLETGVVAVVDRLAATPQQDMWPWLSLLTALCSHHPELVTEADLLSLLHLCSENLQTCKDPTTTEYLYRCCDALLYVESHKDTKLLDTVRLKELWESVWDTSLRAVGLNLSEAAAHGLVRRLVRSGKPLAVRRLLQLFVSGAIHRSEEGLRTLLAVAGQHCVAELLGVQQCKVLMDWVLPSREETTADDAALLPCTELVSEALVAFTVKSRAPSGEQLRPLAPVTGVERLYLFTAFEGGLVTGKEGGEEVEERVKEELLTEPELVGHMTLAVTREHFAAKESVRQPVGQAGGQAGACGAVHSLALNTRLLAHVTSVLRRWQLSVDNSLDAFLVESCELTAEAVKEVLMRRSDIPTLSAVLGRLVDLLQLIADTQSADVLSRLGTSYIIKACKTLAVVSQRAHQPANDFDFEEMDVTPANHSEEISPFSEDSVQGWAHVQLTAYRSALQASRRNPDFIMVLLELPTTCSSDVSPTTALHMALSAARMVCAMPTSDDQVISSLLILLQHLCRLWHANDIATISILDIFQDVCDHLGRCSDEDNWSNYIVLVSGILKYIRKKKYGAHVCDKFVRLLGHIALVDGRGQWTSRMTDDGTSRPLSHELLSFLTSPFHQVRMTACQKIWTLFSTSTIPQQQMVFDDLLSTVNDIFIIQGDLAAAETEEEGVLRTASALHCLAAVLAVTLRWRARALFTVALLTVDKTLNTELVKKMLTVVAGHLGLGGLGELVQPMLPAVVWAWHERFGNFDRFPWPVLGYTSENRFYQASLAAVVPVLVHRRDANTLKHVSSVMGQNVSQLIQTCYPALLGSILPRFADENQQQTATIIIGIVEKYLGDDKVNNLLVTKMGDVITNMLGSLYDPDSLRALCDRQSPLLPEPSKLAFSTDLVLGGIHYIQENSPNSDIPLLVYLSQEKPRLIQKTLLKLYSKVHQTKIPEYKLLYLHQFVSMCDLIVSVIGEPQFKMPHYTVAWVSRMLLHLVAGGTGLLAVCYLEKFLAAVLPTHAALVDDLLSIVTSRLVPLASPDTIIGRKVLSVLELLLVTHAPSLPRVARLDPLPSEPMFAAMSRQYAALRYAAPLSTSLRAEIEHVLTTGAEDCVCRPEGLRHLRKQLSEKKFELEQLYSELRATRGFSEDCERSIIHQLVSLLIRITAGPDPEARYEAACCLGELGPADLTTFGLKPHSSSSAAQPLESFLQTVLTHLVKYLFDSDFEVVQATSDALYTLFGNFGQRLSGLLTSHQTELLYPFISTAKGQRRPVPIAVDVDTDVLATVLPLFCPEDICCHRRWLSRLVNAILNTVQFGFLTTVIDHKEEFPNDLFPVLVDCVLDVSDSTATTQLFVDQINEFFLRHINNSSSDEVYSNRNSVSAMLKVVDCVRKYILQERQINYLHVSKAALYCSAYFTAVMYAELWASEFNSNRQDLDVEGVSQLEFIEEQHSENGRLLQDLLREAYMKIGEPDAVYGCGNTYLLDPRSQIQRYQYEGQWLRAVEACDLQLSLRPQLQLPGFENALHLSGLHHLAGRVSPQQSYEAAWRLGQWELPPPGAADQSHEAAVYTALRSLRDSDTARALGVVRRARIYVMESLADTSLEAATNVYAPLAKLRALQEIEDFASLNFFQVTEKWEGQDKLGWNNFTNIETILSQRMALLKIGKALDQERLVSVVTRLCETAKSEGFQSVAHSWLMSLPGLSQLPPHLQQTVQLLQAQIYWDKQETDTARHLLRRLLGQLRDSERSALYARTLHTFGSLVAHTRTEQAQQILENYLIPAVDNSDDEFKLSAALSLARYTDSEYQTLLNYINSSAYTNKINSITESLSKAEKLNKAAASTKAEVDRQARIDLQKTINMHDKQSKIDQLEVENAQRELDNFLILTIRHYLLSLELGDHQDLCVFRVVSLWLANYDHADLAAELEERLARVPSHKLLPVLPQLVARISDDSGGSTAMLHGLIERCARDHPHHVLPLIMALANTYKDAEFSKSTINTGSKPEGRVVGAQKMLDKLKQKEPLKTLIRDMQKVAEAYISLAYLSAPDAKNTNNKVHKIPKSEPITKLKSMGHILCPTVTLPISKSGNYKDIVGIHGFDETYSGCGGINAPKKLNCICTDGLKRPQLVKGNDDLRQDAVMQQVFTIMNSLLRDNRETRRRRLLIRTYKVVPLSQRSGVLEWCMNTTPIGTWLIGENVVGGAHARLRKDLDWHPKECRKKTAEVAKESHATRLRTFREICANFKPVFRHFFFEKFPNPGIWFERKLAYTHSVATSSMVGYILGIGDRHTSNILIDEHTAEVIHIDFGIAFEQGLTLMTAETVPFRLTRDTIDGMGVSGIEGVFRRSCEKTMEVMREHESTIVTILEVLLYDPLYMWTITPAMALAKQSGKKPSQSQLTEAREQGKVNKVAERVLLRLKQKLQGIKAESTMSVEGQVSKLIQDATNPANLCRLYFGWDAYA